MATPAVTTVTVSTGLINDTSQMGGTKFLSSCTLIDLSLKTSQDNNRDPVSREIAYLFTKVKEVYIFPVLFFFGFVTNCLNVAVFCRQGMRHRIHLCLVTLAVVDMIFVTYVFLKNVDKLAPKVLTVVASSIRELGPVSSWLLQNRFSGFYSFAAASMFVSAVIATERCVCVTWPLRSQTLLSTRTMASILAIGLVFIVGTQFYLLNQYEPVCLYDLSSGKEYLQAKKRYYGNPVAIDVMDTVVYGIAFPVACILDVTVATVITVASLAQTTRFRQESSSRLSSKEIALTKMLVALSVQFVVLNLPMGVPRALKMLFPEFSLMGRLSNTFELTYGLIETCLMVNCSTSFLVYLVAGSKYRNTLRDMTRCHPRTWIQVFTARCKNWPDPYEDAGHYHDDSKQENSLSEP